MSKPPQLLAPRLYRTDIDILNALSVDWVREEFESLRVDFEADWNRAHFKWEDDALDLDYSPLWDEFYEFLNRSAIGEFSGCLLYSDVHKKLKDPTLASIYKCMARDEARHSPPPVVPQLRHAEHGTPFRPRKPAQDQGHAIHASQVDLRHHLLVRNRRILSLSEHFGSLKTAAPNTAFIRSSSTSTTGARTSAGTVVFLRSCFAANRIFCAGGAIGSP